MHRRDDQIRIVGHVVAELRDRRGALRARHEVHNLITDVGDQYIVDQLYSSPSAMTGMKLGSASTAAAKNGAGSYVGGADYVSGSAKAFDATWPKEGASANIVQFKRTFAAGEATGTIRRASIVDNQSDAGEADASHTAAVAVFDADIPKGAGDTLTITWDWTILGS